MVNFTTKANLFVSAALILFIWGCKQKKDYDPKNHRVSKDSVALWLTEAQKNDALLSNQKKGLLNKAFKYAEANYSDSVKTRAYSKISLAYKDLADTLWFKKINADLMVLALKIEDYQSLGEAHWDLGSLYQLSKPDSAYYHYKEAYQFFLRADLEEPAEYYPGWMLYAMAQVKNNNKDYVGAEKDVVKAISFFKDNGVENRLFDAYNLLGNIQTALNNFEKSLEYHHIAKSYLEKDSNKWFSQFVLNKNNIAMIHLRKGEYNKAIELFNELVGIDSFKTKEPISYARALGSLANAKFKNGDNNTDSIKQLLRQSNKMLDSMGEAYAKARNHEFMAEVLAHKKDTAQAIREALVSKELAETTNNNYRLLSTFELLSQIDRKKSAGHATAYFSLNKELQAQERSIRDKFARIQMETDEVIEQNEALSRQKKIWTSVAVGLLLLAIAVYVIINQRAKNQKLKFQQKQQENNQEIYNLMLAQQGKFQEGKQLEQKRISEELHDGILGQMLGIRLILTGLNERDDEASVNQRAELIEKLRELEEEIRTISHELNAASYQKIHNFILAIDDLVKSIGESAKINCSFTYDGEMDWDKLSGNLKINTYRIVQESLQNCVKHAKCENVLVNFETLDDNKLKVTINDDGKGFDINKGKRGIGLKNVISRVEKINGTLSIDSKIGSGTSVIVTFDKIYNSGTPVGELLGSSLAQQQI